MRLTLTMVLLFSGCMSAGTLRGGTAVGNPPDAKIRTEVGESVTLSTAELRDAQLVLAPCDLAQPVTDDALGVVSLLDGPAVALTGQAPCGVALKAEGLILDGVTDDGSVVAIALEDFDVELGRDSGWTQASFEREGHFVLELGEPGWLHDMRLELADDDLVIDAARGRGLTAVAA